MSLSAWLWVGMGLLLVLAVPAWGRRRGRRRSGPGPFRRLLAALLFLLALVLGLAGALLHSWQWLHEDVPVAELSLRQLGTQWYIGRLQVGDDAGREFELRGDEWQLDARVLRWKLPGQLAGLRPVYRLERLSGRYGDPKQELAGQRSVHDLREGWEAWEIRQRALAALPVADARWGSSAYLPMLDGATFRIFLSPTGGLVAKPADARTEALLREAGW
ncbi:MAG TPA: hypothetical protein VKZ64_05235 [Arenimonas sp.]|jgi:hypothetical protein|nr:hypothetical protein [Arenimonas sp.]